MDEVRKFFLTLDLREVASVGLLDSRHVFIKLANEVDFHRCGLVASGMSMVF